MNLNPEFQRQLQLEFSQARLVGVPLILGIIFTLTYFLDNQTHNEVSITAQTALGLFLLMVSFWGARQAVDSVLEEQRSHTWDTQRLSALDPWTMVCGKLLGSTLVVWYGGVICLLVYGLAADNLSNLLWVYGYAITSGLLVQNISLLLSLIALRKGQINSNSVITGLAIIAAFTIGSWIMPLSSNPQALQAMPDASWYGISTTSQFLTLMTVCWALFWCVVGNYRLMTQELRIRTLPWVWFAFALFLIVYAGGFIEAQHFSEYFYTTAFAICLTLSYLIVFTEYNEPMRIKRLLTYITQENWQRAAEELPLWCVTFVLAAVVALPLSFTHPADIEELHVYPITILLFLLRDIGIFLFFSFGKNPQRAFSLTLLSFVLLYGVLPGIFAAADLKAVSALFFPLVADSMIISIICMGVQSALVWYVLYQRWQESV
ncbi:MAG: ABC transporter permease [Methylococcales bacterium]|nr:ABC transporter permease [Methylococcales bacterium]